MSRDWNHPFFDDFYLRGYRDHLLEPERTEEDVAMVDAFWRAEGAERAKARTLDLGCGYGRHSWGLARLGWRNVVGLDAEPKYIAAAEDNPGGPSVKHPPSWEVARMERMPFESESFGAACCLFNTLGYLGAAEAWEDAQDGSIVRPASPTRDPQTTALRELARVLRPGSPVLLDLPDRRELLSLIREHARLITATEGCSMTEDYEWEPRAAVLRIHSKMAISSGEGELASVQTRTADCFLRLYSPAEIKRRLELAGFEAIDTDHPTFQQQPEEMFDGRMIVVARRAAY